MTECKINKNKVTNVYKNTDDEVIKHVITNKLAEIICKLESDEILSFTVRKNANGYE